jgi:xanthine dehydrogenase YagS FAD-binding subunit
MQLFRYTAAASIQDAVRDIAGNTGSRFIAGGTCLVDLMKLDVETPSQLVDVNRLGLANISDAGDGAIRIEALCRNSTVAYHPLVRQRYPLLSDALLAGASAQLRNMATVGGNLMQRTRCSYFRDLHQACNKRNPASGCGALDGYHRGHAILGTSDHCIATHPSDMCVALVCLDAVVEAHGPGGERRIPVRDFHTLPGATPHIETVLQPGELIVAVYVGKPMAGGRSRYVKIRDRASYEFALVSVAALMAFDGDKIGDVRIAFGGVATKPWRADAVEDALRGRTPTPDLFRDAAQAAVADAMPRRHNRFKVELLKRTLIRTLSDLTGVES